MGILDGWRYYAAATIGGMTGFLLTYFVAGQALNELMRPCEVPTGEWQCTQFGVMLVVIGAIGSSVVAGAALAAAAESAAGCDGAAMTGLAAVPVLAGLSAALWFVGGVVDVSEGVFVGGLLASLAPALWLARRLGQAWHEWLLKDKAVPRSD